MSVPSWWLHYHCFLDQAPVTPLQGTLVSKGLLPAYLMELELSVRSPGHGPFTFNSEKEKIGKEKKRATDIAKQ